MKILLDTHYLIWSFTNPEKLPQWAADLLVSDESEVFFSQASLWEIAIKFNAGKLVLKGMTPEELYEEIEMSHFQCLPLRNEELISFHRLDFVQYLRSKAEKQEIKDRADFSLSSAMRRMEDEEAPYSLNDIKESFS